MKFYNRDMELQEINKIINRKNSDLIYLYGRRRVGKTSLILKALEEKKFLYFFVGEKSKQTLLNDFNEIVQKHFNTSYLKFSSFKDLLAFLFDKAKEEKLIIVFDEFQNFWSIDKSIFSDLQYFWDVNKNTVDIKLFFLGSHFTLIKKIFEANKQPLYGRSTGSFYIKQFSLDTQREILRDYDIYYTENLLYFYSIFGGIAKYIEVFLREYDNKKDFKENIFSIIFKQNSFFLNEAKDIFALEFGKSYSKYFSILEAIALGNTKKNEISNYTGISTDSLGVYIQKLEKFYELIVRNTSIDSKKSTTNSHYKIQDLFLNFWFKYIFKNENYLEIGDFETLKDMVRHDMISFLGFSFESLSKEFFIKQNIDGKLPFKFDTIGNYFDKKGTNEIDLILKNTKERKIMFVECKINNNKIDIFALKTLRQKVENIGKYKNYEQFYGFMSLEKSEYDFPEGKALLYGIDQI